MSIFKIESAKQTLSMDYPTQLITLDPDNEKKTKKYSFEDLANWKGKPLDFPLLAEYMHAIDTELFISCKAQRSLMELVRWVLSHEEVYIDYDTVAKAYFVPKSFRNYDLQTWQKFITTVIHGFRFRDTNELVFKAILTFAGRGAGKTDYLLWNYFFMLSDHNPVVIEYETTILGKTGKQVKKNFYNPIYNTLKFHERYSEDIKPVLSVTADMITNKKRQHTLSMTSMGSTSKAGEKTSCLVAEEIHSYISNQEFQKLINGVVKKEDGRIIIPTTVPSDDDRTISKGTPVFDHYMALSREFLENYRDYDIRNLPIFPFICEIEEVEEAYSIETLAKANPSFYGNPVLYKENIRKVEKYAIAYQEELKTGTFAYYIDKEIPAFIRENGNFVLEIDSEDRITSNSNIKNAFSKDYPAPKSKLKIPAIFVIDYSQKNDLCGTGALYKLDGNICFEHLSYISRQSKHLGNMSTDLLEHAESHGHLAYVDGEVILASDLLPHLKELSKRFNFIGFTRDRYSSPYVTETFLRAGYRPLSSKDYKHRKDILNSHSEVYPMLTELFAENKLILGKDDRLLEHFFRNVKVIEKSDDKIEFGKFNAKTLKTDGAMAFIEGLRFEALLTDINKIKVATEIKRRSVV